MRHEFDILLVFMFDRLGRIESETPFIVEWFVKQGIRVWSVKEGEQRFESHVDKLTNYIRFWQAAGESEKTSIRIRTRLAQIAEAGHYHGGAAPYGYESVFLGRLNKHGAPVKDLQVVPEEAAIVKLTLRGQGATRLKGPALAHFCVAVPRISAASPSVRRLELDQSRPFQGKAFSRSVPPGNAARPRSHSGPYCKRPQQSFMGCTGRENRVSPCPRRVFR